MNISKLMATQIISEMKKVIPYKINIMNPDGRIIASSDETRVGSLHMGARLLVKGSLKELCIKDFNEYDGGLPGTNFPIIVKDEIVGVLGITGDYETIRPYAQIIKRMSEILIMDESLKSEQMRETYRLNSFLYEWIHSKSSSHEQELYERGLLLGVDIRKERRFLHVALKELLREEELAVIEHCIRKRMYGDKDAFVLRMSSSFFLGVHGCKDDELKPWVESLCEDITHTLSYTLFVGIDAQNKVPNKVYDYFTQAKKALRAGIHQQKQMFFYEDISMDLFMEEVSSQTQKEFIYRIFRTYKKEELKGIICLLECYYKHNGSIQLASSELYLHKNTLQNRLNKIKDKTGYDPRSLKDIPLFAIAIQFYRYQETKL